MLRSSLFVLCLVVASSVVHAQDVVYSPSSLGTLKITTVVKNLANPWGMAFLPDGRLLITERPGRLRIFSQGQISPAVTGTPAVYAQGQGGLLDDYGRDHHGRCFTVWMAGGGIKPGVVHGETDEYGYSSEEEAGGTEDSRSRKRRRISAGTEAEVGENASGGGTVEGEGSSGDGSSVGAQT